MKAAIILNGSTPSKTHRLIRLDDELSAVCPHWSTNRDELRLLTRAAVDFRYPGETAVFEEADEAVNVARKIRSDLMALLRS